MLYNNRTAKRFCIFITLLISSVFFVSNLFALEKKDSNIVRVGYYKAPDFQNYAEDGTLRNGYAYEYYRKLAEYTGWRYEYVYGTYDELYERFKSGEIDLLAGIIKDFEKDKEISFPTLPMGYTNYSILVQVENPKTEASPKILNNKIIGINDGPMETVLISWLKNNNVHADYVTYLDNEQMFKDFENKKIDSIVTNVSTPFSQYEDIVTLSGRTDYFLCVTKNRVDLLNKLNEAQTELIDEEPNFISDIRRKYFPKSALNQSFNKSEYEWIKHHQIIRIGYLNDYLPYSGTDKNGEVAGVIKNLVPNILEQLDLQSFFDVVYYGYNNFESMIRDLSTGKLDVVFPICDEIYYAEENGIYKSNSVFNTTASIIYKKNSVRKQEPIFAVNANNTIQEYFIKRTFPEVAIAYYSSIDECLDAIKKGQADCTTINGLRVDSILKNSKYDSLESTILPVPDDHCFGVQFGNEGLLKVINKGLSCIPEQTLLNSAYKYSVNLYKYTFVDFLKSNVIPITIVLIIIVSIIFHFMANDNRRKEAYLDRETKKNEELKKLHREQETQLIEIKLLNAALEQSRKNIEKYINDMIRYASSGDDPDSVLHQLLDYLGRNTGGDRIYIFEVNNNGNYANTYEWCKKGVSAQIDNLQDVPSEAIDHWIRLFRQSKAVVITDLEKDKIAYPALYDVLKPQDIHSLVAVPIVINREIIGLLGVDNPPKESLDTVSEFLFLVEFIFSQMIRMRNNNRSIQESAYHDQLTGCPNRKALVNTFNKNYNEDASCCVVACDMNGLKQVNDGQGHEAGDKFICRTADTLGDVFGAENVYRMGGDEFTIILFGKTKAEFDSLIEQCKLQIGTTASIGYTYVEKLNLSLDDIMRQADMAMYKEKDRFYQNKGVRRHQTL